MLCIIALSCFFSGASVARWWRLECKRLFCFSAKSVTEKNNRRVDCAEADKKTVQALHFDRLSGRQAERADEKGRGFLAAGDCPAALPVIYFQVKPDRFLSYFLPFLFLSIVQIKQIFYIWISENIPWLRSCGCGGHQSLC